VSWLRRERYDDCRNGQTFRSPPAEPGVYLLLIKGQPHPQRIAAGTGARRFSLGDGGGGSDCGPALQ
ncbi:MAG: hypothetical protein Q7J23_11750, partial [Nitrosomonas sp.]|nr:hypothetical protein [Nitrosomonas sp.]